MQRQNSNKFRSNREQSLFLCENLQNPQSYFISKQNITLHYTKFLRDDILTLMKEKQIGWTEICRKLRTINYNYSPIPLQLQVSGKTKMPKDISYFVPILILLNT